MVTSLLGLQDLGTFAPPSWWSVVAEQTLLVFACQATSRTDDTRENSKEEHAETDWTDAELVTHH